MTTRSRVRRRVGAMCLLLAVAAGPAVAHEGVRALVEREMADGVVGGLSVGVVEGDRLVYSEGFGLADIERRVPARADHVYRIGSITKQLTAYALLALQKDGALRLTDPVASHVPEFGEIDGRGHALDRITLYQLATMTSGLAREPDDLETHLVGPASEWTDVALRALAEVSVEHPPGTRYQYSNIGYAILGLAVERASGHDYMDFVRESFLAPLGMDDTDFVPRSRFEERIAIGYVVGDDGSVDDERPAWEHLGRGYKVPNGALYSTVADLARFISFQLGHGPDSVLPRRLLEENFATKGSSTGDLSSGYGVGFRVTRSGELIATGHTGSVAGYRAAALFDRASGKGVVVLRNVTGGELDVVELAMAILERVASED